MWTKPKNIDAWILSLFTVLITFNPFFMHGPINFFELGLYLPGIQSIIDGQIPFKDFFYLRGPFELYMPALLMKIFGMHIKVIYAYFYAGNILALILCVWIAKELLKTRLFFYLLVPVLVARTFPRVVFTFWGGMRFALGLLAVLFLIKYFKQQKKRWLLGSGIITGIALFTSIEVGVCAFLGVVGALILYHFLSLAKVKSSLENILIYGMGLFLVCGPYVLYLFINHAFGPYIDSTLTVLSRMQGTFPQIDSSTPKNTLDFFVALVSPGQKGFKHLTPVYCYIFFIIYLMVKSRREKLTIVDFGAMGLAIYGLMAYIAAFRNIEASQFEIALQPEKIVLFLLLEFLAVFLLTQQHNIKPFLVKGFLILIVISSLGYSIQRYHHRFFVFKWGGALARGQGLSSLDPRLDKNMRSLRISRAQGIFIPHDQADEIEGIVDFLLNKTKAGDQVLLYPEMGIYNFLSAKPVFGKFPIITFAWMNTSWFEAFMREWEKTPPRLVVMEKDFPEAKKRVYFSVPSNQEKHEAVMKEIQSNYTLLSETNLSKIYKLK